MKRKQSQVKAERSFADRQKALGRNAKKFWLTDAENEFLREQLAQYRGQPNDVAQEQPEQPQTVRGQTWDVTQLERIRDTASQHADRIYLLVPKNERNEAKQYGARFDGSCMCWFFEEVQSALVERWPRP